jgi:hypothetical protein
MSSRSNTAISSSTKKKDKQDTRSDAASVTMGLHRTVSDFFQLFAIEYMNQFFSRIGMKKVFIQNQLVKMFPSQVEEYGEKR